MPAPWTGRAFCSGHGYQSAKPLWTSSFASLMAGLRRFALAVRYWIVDVKVGPNAQSPLEILSA
jgi:predicted acyltransferase